MVSNLKQEDDREIFCKQTDVALTTEAAKE